MKENFPGETVVMVGLTVTSESEMVLSVSAILTSSPFLAVRSCLS